MLTIPECDCYDCSIATRKACSKLQRLTEAAGASALVMIPCRPSPKITALQVSNRFKPKCRVIECMSPCEDMSDMSWFPVVWGYVRTCLLPPRAEVEAPVALQPGRKQILTWRHYGRGWKDKGSKPAIVSRITNDMGTGMCGRTCA